MHIVSFSQNEAGVKETTGTDTLTRLNKKVHYGTASFYAEKFNGRKTANGETYDGEKYTAACNLLPLGTWIRVTNSRNKKSVIVKINDRLHPKMTRIVDLSRVAAEKLDYINRGLTQVKVEVLGKKKPE
jgi:rare lipoprotein A